MKKAYSAVASVSTSGVWVKGILWRLAAARSMLSTPTAIWETTLSPVALPAARISSSILSRSVVISAWIPPCSFSSTSRFGGGWTLRVDLDGVAPLAQTIERGLAYVAGGVDADGLGHVECGGTR